MSFLPLNNCPIPSLGFKCRAADIVLTLQAADRGVAITQLRRGDESIESIHRILRYPQFYEWIDVSAKGKRAWLLSTARKWLEA